jgi:hypothetical protein
MGSSIYISDEITVCCNGSSEFTLQEGESYSPINVRKSKIVTAGPTRGNMRAYAEAKTTANTQAPVANDGL